MFTMTLLFAVVFLVILQATVSVSQGVALTVAGIVAPILSQLLKRFTGMSGNVALGVTILVCAAITIGAMYFTGDIHTVGDVAKQIGTVFAIATVVYKVFLPSGPTPTT